MRILVTAGPTREYIDSVRFLTNASSGRMGFALADAAAKAGHHVTLLAGPVELPLPQGVEVIPFVSVEDLQRALAASFPACDALVMAAAVGDFRPEAPPGGKMHRSAGVVTIRLLPTEDLVAELAARKRSGQVIVAFSVEDGPADRAQLAARAKMLAKKADYIVANTPAAMGAGDSEACVLSPAGVVVPWQRRDKRQLAEVILAVLDGRK